MSVFLSEINRTYASCITIERSTTSARILPSGPTHTSFTLRVLGARGSLNLVALYHSCAEADRAEANLRDECARYHLEILGS
jgi:hypothetical protein